MNEKRVMPQWLQDMGPATFSFYVGVVVTLIAALWNYFTYFHATLNILEGLKSLAALYAFLGTSVSFHVFIALGWNWSEGCAGWGVGLVHLAVVSYTMHLAFHSGNDLEVVPRVTLALFSSFILLLLPMAFLVGALFSALGSSGSSSGIVIFIPKK